MRVFVYGSLMRGQGNHRLMAGARFLSQARIKADRYRMISLGGFPGLVAWGDGPAIAGEAYEAGPEVMERLDRLEGHPDFYHREPVALEGESSGSAIAYVLTGPLQPWHGREFVESGDWRAHRGGGSAGKSQATS
jgi:gamma-glutamylaminecyclotransferase